MLWRRCSASCVRTLPGAELRPSRREDVRCFANPPTAKKPNQDTLPLAGESGYQAGRGRSRRQTRSAILATPAVTTSQLWFSSHFVSCGLHRALRSLRSWWARRLENTVAAFATVSSASLSKQPNWSRIKLFNHRDRMDLSVGSMASLPTQPPSRTCQSLRKTPNPRR